MKDISCFLDKHQGEKAWIFGKGPSLDHFNLEQAGKLRICINESVTVVSYPSYFFAHDEIPIKKSAQKYFLNCLAILPYVRAKYAVDCGISEDLIYTYEKKNKDINVLKWSPEEIATKSILYGHSGTVHSALHFCYLIGVSEVIFVGFDGKGGYANCLNLPETGKYHRQIRQHSIDLLKKLKIPCTYI